MSSIKVIFLQRKPLWFHRSIESIFENIRANLPVDVIPITLVFRRYSTGLFNRVAIMLQAFANQGDVNHITGDTHFVALLLKRRKTLLTIHDCGMLADAKGIKHRILKLFWFTLPLKKVRFVTVVSEATKNDLLRYVKFQPENIFVIPNPVSTVFVKSPKVFNSERPQLLQVGTIHNKNINRLVEAINGLPVHLNLVGKPDDQLKKLLSSCKISYSVFFNLTDQELYELYRQSDILTFVSTYEGFGMPIIEANLTGRPVITSNLLSMPEVAGKAAHLVDPYDVKAIRDGILRLLHDPGYREQLIEAGYENARRFNIEVISNQYYQLYKKIYSEA